MRVLVHRVSESVSAEVEVDRDALFVGDVADRLGDVAEAAARLGGVDTGFQPGPRRVDETLVRIGAFADDDGAGGVATQPSMATAKSRVRRSPFCMT